MTPPNDSPPKAFRDYLKSRYDYTHYNAEVMIFAAWTGETGDLFRAGMAFEREECAKVAEEMYDGSEDDSGFGKLVGQSIGQRIRERKP